MKIWVDSYLFNHEEMNRLIHRFPDIDFENDLEQALDATIMISMPNKIRPEILNRMTQLKWVQLLTAGYDKIDLNDLARRKIAISYAKDVFSIQIAEDVFSKILFLNRRLDLFYDQQKNASWIYHDLFHDIYGSQVGIIGAGSIGTEIAKRMKAFGAHVTGYKRNHENLPYFDHIITTPKELDLLIQTSDIIIIAIPLSKDTHHLIGKRELEMMKPSACLINVARGDIIDQQALIHALEEQTIRAAGIDVTSPEPLPKDSPLWHQKNLLLTPHNASASQYLMTRVVEEVMDSLNRYLTHEPLDNQIDTQG